MVISILATIYLLMAAFAILLLIYDDRDPNTTLVWILAIVLLPYIGLPLYYFLGRNWYRTSKRRREFLSIREELEKFFRPFYRKYRRKLVKPENVKRAISLTESFCGTYPVSATSVEIMPSGKQKFSRLEKDLKSAKAFIVLQYFIWEKDELTGRLTKILLKKLAEGVEVYLMYDFFGCFMYSKEELRELRRAGAIVRADVTNLNMVNYRNHRKIAVIDGVIGYTGGINVGQEYIDGGVRFESWRDDAVRMEGPIVSSLLSQFAVRLYERTKIDIFKKKYFPDFSVNGNSVTAQLALSSIDNSNQAISNLYASAVGNAKIRAWFQSPYFVPTEHFYQSMLTAAKTGVDVRLMITGKPDKKLPWYAAFSYFDKLLQAGVKVYLYEAGFLHAKMATFDKEFFSVGTCNLDTRSLALHDELTILFYDQKLTATNDRIFERDIKKCRELTLSEMKKIGRIKHFRNSLARLFSKVI